MDLNVLVMQSLQQLDKEGFVQEVVTDQLKSTVKSIVKDLFCSYSQFGKQLEQEVKDQLNINLSKLDIAKYNVMVLNVVKEHLDLVMHEHGVQRIKEQLDELLADSKDEYKLSELVEEMKKEALQWDSDLRGCQISMHLDRKYSIYYLALDPNEDVGEYRCKYRISFNKEDGTINSIKIDGESFDNKVIMGGLNGFDATLFKMFAHKSKLIIDEENVGTYYESDDDY